MSISELTSKIRELRELKAFAAELSAEIASMEDEIKNHMGETEELKAGEYTINYKWVKSTRIDSKALKAELPIIAEKYTTTSEYRRFAIV